MARVGASIAVTRNDFGRIAATIEERAAAAVTDTAQAIAEHATAGAPFPEIADSIAVEVDDEFTQAVTVGVWWAGFWEYGTSGFAARPFLTPATERYRNQLAQQTMAAFKP